MTAPFLCAQISNPIEAQIDHKFTIANTTLPPGRYIFRMVSGTDLSAMTASTADGSNEVEFLVRQSQADHTPKHSELFFNRYGNHEFLTKIYEQGSQMGVAVAEPSRIESRLLKQGQHGVEHREEQKK